MKLARKAGATSQILQIFIADTSSSTGGGLTGLAVGGTVPTTYYHRDTDTTATAITLVTMTVGTFTSSGFKEVDATNMPGWYQLCPPNAALAAGAVTCAIHLKGATNMAPLPIEVDLGAQVDVSSINAVSTSSVTTINANVGTTQPQNFTGTGASALVKTDMVDIAGAAVSTTTAQIGVNAVQINGQTTSAAGTVTFPGTIASTTNITAGTITTVTNLTNAPTAGDLTATMKTSVTTAATAATPAAASVTGNVGGNVTGSIGSLATQAKTDAENAVWNAVRASHTTPGTFGGDTITPPTNFSSLSIDGSGRIDIGKILGTASTGTAGYVGVDWGQLTNKTTTNALTGTTIATAQVVASVSGAVASVTGNVGGSIASLGATAKTDVSTAVLTTQMTESYAAPGVVPTLAQLLFEERAILAENTVSGTTVTTKKIDGTTTAHTYTINSATTPTNIFTAS